MFWYVTNPSEMSKSKMLDFACPLFKWNQFIHDHLKIDWSVTKFIHALPFFGAEPTHTIIRLFWSRTNFFWHLIKSIEPEWNLINIEQYLTTNSGLLWSQSRVRSDSCWVIKLNNGWGVAMSEVTHSISVTAWIFFTRLMHTGVGLLSFRTKWAGSEAVFWGVDAPYAGVLKEKL